MVVGQKKQRVPNHYDGLHTKLLMLRLLLAKPQKGLNAGALLRVTAVE